MGALCHVARCDQGSVVKVTGTGTILYVCQECEASWFTCEDVSVKCFMDYGVYMESIGISPLWSEVEVLLD